MPLACTSQNCDANECVELTDREALVCDAICASREPISFTRLKEFTNLHQEILSRIVYRLGVHGLVRKVDGKYQGICCPQLVDSELFIAG